MSAPSAPRASRRAVLKLGAAAVAAALMWDLPVRPLGTTGLPCVRAQSALPLPGIGYLPFPERLLGRPRGEVDVALVPAHVAALLVQRGLLQPLHGPPGRAHDPEGQYTIPYAYRVAALRFPSPGAAPQSAYWSNLWPALGQSVWPASVRLVLGAALLRRGYSPNDTHTGHLDQAARDLAQLRPIIVSQSGEQFPELGRARSSLAVVLADPSAVSRRGSLRLPAEGTMLIEYDWVILAGPARAAAARQFVKGLTPSVPVSRPDLPVRLIPLMPLPAAASAQQAEIWASLAPGQSSLAA